MITSLMERQFGVHYAMGGMGALVRGLVGLIESQGGELRCNAEVEEILVKDGAATGVRLASGETIDAGIVVSNADSAWTYRKLVPAAARRQWTDRKIDRSRYSMGLFVWYFGVDRRYDDLALHTILLGPRYRALVSDIFDRKVLAEDFSLYLYRPTAVDPSLAPEGCDSFYALSPVPNLLGGQDWRTEAEPYRKRIEQRARGDRPPRSVERDRHLAHDDAARFPEPPEFLPRRRLRARADSDAERLVPSAQPERGRAQSLPGRRRHPSRARGCRACCPPRAFSTRSFRMPQFSFDLASRSDHRECREAIRARLEILLRRLAPVAGGDPAARLRALRLLPALGRRRRPVRRLAGRDRPPDGSARAGGAGAAAALRRRPRDGRPHAPLGDPAALPEALLEGLAWDAEGRSYETLDDLFDYAARVAGTVGVMMTLIMGVRSPEALARACDLGVAMQLTNIARDVGEDARMGRIYLPRQWLREAGVDAEAFLADPQARPTHPRARRAASRRGPGALPAGAGAAWRCCLRTAARRSWPPR